MSSYSSSYSEFSGFLIMSSQEDMFKALQERHPDIIQEVLDGVEAKKKQMWHRQVLVTLYGDYNNGLCPSQLKSVEDFNKFSDFYVHTKVAPQVHNGGWITESISVIGTI